MNRPFRLLVQGMHLRADSIAYDVAFQYRLLRRFGIPVELFAETFDAAHYPGIEARPLDDLRTALRRAPGPVVYHWVDGWRAADDVVSSAACPVILRWHNNTPPWFFADHSPIPTHKTVRGYQDLLRLADAVPHARFWTNSEFSRRQLSVLGITEDRVDVVYPASAYIENTGHARPQRIGSRDGDEPVQLLFVGRVVPHKGHLHLIAAAHAVARMCGRPVHVSLPGRPDGDMPRYVSQVRALARRLGVDVELPGEVSTDALERAYAKADVFVGLSEHEGFGLPILEAMTRGLPVVGYRSSAVSELLERHPLAVDSLDPIEIARCILAALEPRSRQAIATWQERAVLPRFSRIVIEGQLRAALAALGVDLPPVAGSTDDATLPAPTEVLDALERARRVPPPAGVDSTRLARDLNPHFVTRYDLTAYRALLRGGETGDLRGRALGMRFGSHRRTLGGFAGLLKSALLRLQDGLVRTVELSHNDLVERLREIDDRIEEIAQDVESLRRDARGPAATPSPSQAVEPPPPALRRSAPG